MATPRLGLVVEDKPTELSCKFIPYYKVLVTYLMFFTIPFSLTEAVVSKPEGVKGHQEDSTHEEEEAVTPTSSAYR